MTAGPSVSDGGFAREFYEGKLGLSVAIDSGDNAAYRCAGGSVLHVHLSPDHAGGSAATLASWYVDEPTERGMAFRRYHKGPIIADEKGIATFEENAKVAYCRDPDGNALSIATEPCS